MFPVVLSRNLITIGANRGAAMFGHRLWSLCAAILGFAVQVPVHAQAPALAAPAWQLDVQDGRCALVHTDPKTKLRFVVNSWAGEDAHQVIVIGTGLPSLPLNKFLPMNIDLLSGQPLIKHGAVLSRGAEEDSKVVTMSGLDNAFIDGLSHAPGITISQGSKVIGPIMLPKTASGVGALRKCLAEQLTLWNADPSQFQPGGSPPVALIARDDWLPNERLLKIRWNSNRPNARFRLMIATDGKVDGCTLTDPSSSANAEKIVCDAVTSRPLFTPAHNAAGVAVRGVATFHIVMYIVDRAVSS
jgi:hypothetical protein